ncbi:MAG: IS110 family transposase [Candidatus Tectomicrobia bacterium]|nr:IS110 family transposase [Candidatus Tectomicrobia bacterium]
MERIAHHVGLDYHQASVQVCALEEGGRVVANRKTANETRAIVGVLPAGRVRAAIEACSGAAELAEELQRAGWEVVLAHPGYVRRMKLNPDKTDFSDARMLAELVRMGHLPRVWLAPRAVRELRLLVRHREQLARERRAVKLRIRALLREQRIAQPVGLGRWSRAWVAWLGEAPLSEQGRWMVGEHLAHLRGLKERIRGVEARLEVLTRTDPVVARLRELRGVGPITAWWLRAEVGDFKRFRTGKQLARFCGLSPRNASSGARQADAGLIRAGNPGLRACLVQAAHSLARFDPRWRELAGKMLTRGKPRSLVTAAIANRWMRWLHHQMAA